MSDWRVTRFPLSVQVLLLAQGVVGTSVTISVKDRVEYISYKIHFNSTQFI